MGQLRPLFAALVLVGFFGVAEGLWTNRWWESDDRKRAAERLQTDVAMSVGGWRAHSLDMDPQFLALAEIDGYLLRHYAHPDRPESISVLIVSGRAGPISVHPPEVCLGGRGFALTAPPEKRSLAIEALAPAPEFWVGNFRRDGGVAPETLRVYWAWTTKGNWTASDNPRWQFAANSALYKIYVTRTLTRPDEPAEEDPVPELLRDVLPRLQGHLFPQAATPPGQVSR